MGRTVVREAVTALRARGLVVTRQGTAAYVAADAHRRPFQLAFDGLPSLADNVGRRQTFPLLNVDR